MKHICEMCSTDWLTHSEQCDEPDGERHRHWPPLCCPGCPCGSFEAAHPSQPPNPEDHISN